MTHSHVEEVEFLKKVKNKIKNVITNDPEIVAIYDKIEEEIKQLEESKG